ncbi:DUF4181 domain-containing protein [Sporolactobacillus shoreae]|uniref:DUF4181 domain-containing protein n=1 Tax=Sporolactobacillus shoreae TaxID=1465501 RepID=A0A4Z0GMB9_9BACL|nr:DUF4181 domain-containing protein [Sporolactobacillus shoreae]TGA97393.1 DUF4181 domain-containing protein [Sporolactobacillus shoreae]
MFYIIGIIIVMFCILFSVDRVLRKKLQIPKVEGFIYQPVNKMQAWVETSLFILMIILMFFFMDYVFIYPLFFLFFEGIRAFFEWKYSREKKQYLITMLWGIGYLLALTPFWLFK